MPRSLATWSARVALVVFGLFSAETVLDCVSAISPAIGARLSGLRPSYVTDPMLDVRGDPTSAEYDETGFRNAVRPAHATIVAIGDSQTQGSGVARENAWPQQLGRIADIDVYQLAFGSYGPGHYLYLVDDALTLGPELLIVGVYTGNDLAETYDWVYGKGRNAELRSTDAELLASLERANRERGPIKVAWQEARNAEKGLIGRPPLQWLYANVEEKSKLVALYEQLRWRLSGERETLATDPRPRARREVERIVEQVGPDTLFPYADGELRTVFTPRARLSTTNLDDVRIAESLRVMLAMLDRIATRAATARTQLCVLLIPTKELVFARRVAETAPWVPAVFTELGEMEEKIRGRIKAFLDERRICWIDPLEALRDELHTEGPLVADASPYVDDWDGHPAPVGHEAIARAVVHSGIVPVGGTGLR